MESLSTMIVGVVLLGLILAMWAFMLYTDPSMYWQITLYMSLIAHIPICRNLFCDTSSTSARLLKRLARFLRHIYRASKNMLQRSHPQLKHLFLAVWTIITHISCHAHNPFERFLDHAKEAIFHTAVLNELFHLRHLAVLNAGEIEDLKDQLNDTTTRSHLVFLCEMAIITAREMADLKAGLRCYRYHPEGFGRDTDLGDECPTSQVEIYPVVAKARQDLEKALLCGNLSKIEARLAWLLFEVHTMRTPKTQYITPTWRYDWHRAIQLLEAHFDRISGRSVYSEDEARDIIEKLSSLVNNISLLVSEDEEDD